MNTYQESDIISVPIPNTNGFMDLTGQSFARLSVICFAGYRGTHKLWWCKCDCGMITKPSSCSLRTGQTKSCGCYCIDRLRETHKIHGISDSRTHRSWMSMRDRCNNENNSAYHNYGGRGIKVCKRWDSFIKFLEDMGECPAGYTINRSENNKDYTPDNCEWVSYKTNNRNKRSSRFIVVNGVSMNTAAAAEKFHIQYKTLMKRLYDGWSDHEAVFGRSK